MNKKDIILDAMLELLKEKSTVSISEIANKAGIAKGGIYYYYSSKEEITDSLIERSYGEIIENCKKKLHENDVDALSKFRLLFTTYFNQHVTSEIDTYLHLPQNAELHQKSLAKILTELSPILTDILKQGMEEGTFSCNYPEVYSEIILSVFTFLLDPGIFHWTVEQVRNKLKGLADLLERGLLLPTGSMSILYEQIK
ncbi:TetR/AcrR family transcriptional regulator [Anaerocolumna chitinilytica]|uniref:TetR family transcriptional regulator n=1 Tax=Anaerocolumna chitinilytica TaxID=1727145 RepID=A0A7I8DRP1_9FIRM|nr:TetR/AcrR family transcriptional regulator [Anaerocolumna chitinilytica]BCK01050.1 TetR family transcriptional regulator [Anaerocolumna chitinilytica]